MPDFLLEYGIRPWDMERLTLRETADLIERHNERVDAMRKASAGRGRR